MRPLSLLISFFVAALLTLFLFTCTTAPNKGPTDRSNTTITLVGKSSKNITSSDMVEDSVGNMISIGFYSNFPYFLDSVQLRLIISDIKDSMLQTFTNLTSLNSSDISWHSLSFSDSGIKTIYGKAYINDYNKPASDSITVFIHGKPLNRKPTIKITGLTTISVGQQCSFIVTIIDQDSTQKDSVILSKRPSEAVFNSGTFLWTPPTGFIGNDTAVFIAWDNGYPVMYDTARVAITVIGSSSNHAPAWQKKTINEVGQPGVPIAITLSDKCTDPDGDTLTFSLRPGLPEGDAIITTGGTPVYIFTPGQGDTGVFYPQIVAKDPQGLADTLTIALTINAQKTDSFTLAYNGNGNTGGTVPTDPAAYVTGATVTVKTNSGTLVKTSATFAGWNTAADGSGTSYAAASTFTMGSANVTLYATWTVNPTYAVTYNGNGNTGGTVPIDPGAYVTGATVTVKTNSGTLVKTSATFAGWNTAADGSGTSYAAASNFTMGSANVTLYATWTVNPTYTVTYSGNGNTAGTVPTDPGAYVTGATATVKMNSGTLVKTGATFAGWNTAADGSGTSYAAASTFTMGSANVTLYATWTVNPT